MSKLPNKPIIANAGTLINADTKATMSLGGCVANCQDQHRLQRLLTMARPIQDKAILNGDEPGIDLTPVLLKNLFKSFNSETQRDTPDGPSRQQPAAATTDSITQNRSAHEAVAQITQPPTSNRHQTQSETVATLDPSAISACDGGQLSTVFCVNTIGTIESTKSINHTATEKLANKIAIVVSQDLKNAVDASEVKIILPPSQLNGSNIVFSKNNAGAIDISFMVGNVSVANQLQMELLQLRRELHKKLPSTRFSLNIKQDAAVLPNLPYRGPSTAGDGEWEH